MGGDDQILAGLREHLGWMQETLALLESGKRKIYRSQLASDADDTPVWIDEQKLRIARLKDLITAYERRSS